MPGLGHDGGVDTTRADERLAGAVGPDGPVGPASGFRDLVGAALVGLVVLAAPFDYDWAVIDEPARLRFGDLIAAVAAIGLALRHRSTFWRLPLLVAFGFVVALGLSAATTSGSADAAALVFLRFSLMAVLAGVIAATFGRADRDRAGTVRLIIDVVGIAAFVTGASALVLWWTGDGGAGPFYGGVTRAGPFPRLTHPFSHANVAAAYFALTIPALADALERRRLPLAAVAAVLAVPVAALALTMSRAGLFAVALAAAVCWLAGRRRVAAALGAALVVVVAGATFTSDAFAFRHGLGDQLAAVDVAIDVPAALADDAESVTVAITNRSSLDYLVGTPRSLRVVATWFAPDDHEQLGRQAWTLNPGLARGDTVAVDLGMPQPVGAGDYVVRWTLELPSGSQLSGWGAAREESTVTYRRDPAALAATPIAGKAPADRLTIWGAALQTFVDNPATGVGPGAFPVGWAEARPGQVSPVIHAHNIVLEPLATWGVLGSAFWLVALIAAGRSSLALIRRRAAAVPLVAGFMGLLVFGVVDWPFVAPSAGYPLAVAVGLLVALTPRAYGARRV